MKEQGRRKREWTNKRVSSSAGRGNPQDMTAEERDRVRDGRAGDTAWGCGSRQGRQHGETDACAASTGMSSRCLGAVASHAALGGGPGWALKSGGLQGGGEPCKGSAGEDPCSDEKGPSKALLIRNKDQGKTSGKAGCGEEVGEAGGEPREAGQARGLCSYQGGEGWCSMGRRHGTQTGGPLGAVS